MTTNRLVTDDDDDACFSLFRPSVDLTHSGSRRKLIEEAGHSTQRNGSEQNTYLPTNQRPSDWILILWMELTGPILATPRCHADVEGLNGIINSRCELLVLLVDADARLAVNAAGRDFVMVFVEKSTLGSVLPVYAREHM